MAALSEPRGLTVYLTRDVPLDALGPKAAEDTLHFMTEFIRREWADPVDKEDTGFHWLDLTGVGQAWPNVRLDFLNEFSRL